MFMPEGKFLEFRVFNREAGEKCLIQSHTHERLFHIEAILLSRALTDLTDALHIKYLSSHAAASPLGM